MVLSCSNSLSVPPGTKVYLTGTITVQESFLMLDSSNTRVLGGEVEKLKEKWELNKVITCYCLKGLQSRTKVVGKVVQLNSISAAVTQLLLMFNKKLIVFLLLNIPHPPFSMLEYNITIMHSNRKN